MSAPVLAAAARAVAVATDERILIAVLGSVVIVAALAVSRIWRP